MPKLKNIWIIDEGSPGHMAQSRAVAESLRLLRGNLSIFELQVKRRFSGIQRSMIRTMMGRRGARNPDFLKSLILHGISLPESSLSKPDIIVSSGGKSVFCARILSSQYEVPFVFIGERKPYRSEWFDAVFTPSPREQEANDVQIDLIPTGVTPEKVDQAAANYDRPEGRLWAMIIGGASRSHPFRLADWRLLADGMNDLARDHKIRWLVTTSRRTGREAEECLSERLDPDVLADAVWWGESPRKVMLPFFGAAERVFVTQDSVTMLTEAICSGRPVSVLYPQVVNFPKTSFIPSYLERLETKKWITRFSIKDLKEPIPIPANHAKPNPASWIAEKISQKVWFRS